MTIKEPYSKGKKGQHFHYCRSSGQRVYYSNSEIAVMVLELFLKKLWKWLSRVPSHPYVWIMSIALCFSSRMPFQRYPPKKYVFGSYVNVPEACLPFWYYLTIYALQCKSLMPHLYLAVCLNLIFCAVFIFLAANEVLVHLNVWWPSDGRC